MPEIKKVFALTNRYIILATPLILYSLFSTIYMAVSANGKVSNLLFAIFLFILMTGAFIAGWFKMVKIAVTESDKDNANTLIKEFPAGVGEYFLPSLGVILMMFLCFIVITILGYNIGINFIGNPNISTTDFAKALETPAMLKAFLASLTQEQLLLINKWNLLLLACMGVLYFGLMLYIPALFFKSKNPLLAFLYSLKDLISSKFFNTLGLYILIFVINFVLTLFTVIADTNNILHFIMTLTNFYFVTYVAVGVFYYYNKNFVESHLGTNIDTRI